MSAEIREQTSAAIDRCYSDLLAQEAREICFFPATSAPVTAELTFAAVELFRMHAATAVWQRLIRYDRMQHLVIKHVTQKPQRYEQLIEQRVDADYAILFLDRAKNEIFSWPMFPPAPPYHFVTPKTPPKISLVQIVKNLAQIEMLPFMLQIQLALHRQLRVGDFSFCFFAHLFSSRKLDPAPGHPF